MIQGCREAMRAELMDSDDEGIIWLPYVAEFNFSRRAGGCLPSQLAEVSAHASYTGEASSFMWKVAGCRDGIVYGCGSTEHGQLPYLRFSQDGSADSLEEASMSAAELENIPARNEITIPTQLRLPVRQACSCPNKSTQIDQHCK